MVSRSVERRSRRVVVAMSGGVDSSVSAALMVKAGYDVIGLFAHMWEDPTEYDGRQNDRRCCSLPGHDDARIVAGILGIPLYTANVARQFRRRIVAQYIREYEAGRTPNPCVFCNQEIKFGVLYEHARSLGAELFVTGHYARVMSGKLHAAVDVKKDQSYFLHRIDRAIVPRLRFPIGEYTKDRVRQIAREYALPVADKRASVEACFVKTRSVAPFLKAHVKMRAGVIRTEDGRAVGRHDGLPLYTVGQRKRIPVELGPWYVAEKRMKDNTLVVTHDPGDTRLHRTSFVVRDCRWMETPVFPFTAKVQTRHLGARVSCVVKKDHMGVRVDMREPIFAVTPGQSAVLYDGSRVLGGGVIEWQ